MGKFVWQNPEQSYDTWLANTVLHCIPVLQRKNERVIWLKMSCGMYGLDCCVTAILDWYHFISFHFNLILFFIFTFLIYLFLGCDENLFWERNLKKGGLPECIFGKEEVHSWGQGIANTIQIIKVIFLRLCIRSQCQHFQFLFKISYLDFLLYEMLFHYTAFEATYLDKYPSLKNFKNSFEEIPGVAKYISSSQYIKGPCINPMAKIAF